MKDGSDLSTFKQLPLDIAYLEYPRHCPPAPSLLLWFLRFSEPFVHFILPVHYMVGRYRSPHLIDKKLKFGKLATSVKSEHFTGKVQFLPSTTRTLEGF